MPTMLNNFDNDVNERNSIVATCGDTFIDLNSGFGCSSFMIEDRKSEVCAILNQVYV